jgi:hypothetical protein
MVVRFTTMLVYVDESYKARGTPNCKSTFAAVCMREDRYRAFDTEFFKLKKYFFKIAQPFDLELKGRLLLSGDKIGLPRNREFVRQVMALMREFEVVPFAVVQDGSLQLSALKPDYLPELYRGVLRRVDRYMQEKYPKDCGILFFDGIDHGTNQRVAVAFNNFMFRHGAGSQFQHVLPVPNFSDSIVTPGIQLADVVAYCVNERYVAYSKPGHLEEFFQEFRSMTFTYENPDENIKMWGVTRIRVQPHEEVEEAEPTEGAEQPGTL